MKREFLELLDTDREFRYTVAGYLGLSEVLKRLDDLSEKQAKMVEEQTRLRKEQARIRKEQARLRADFNKMLESIKQLQDGQSRLEERMTAVEEGQSRLEERMTAVEEGQSRLEERMTAVEEGQSRLEERVGSLEEGVKELKEGQARIEGRVDALERRFTSLEGAMISGFGELSKFAGLTFEEFVRKFLTASLRKLGEIPDDAELGRGLVEGEEINLFLEEPLIVGEATGYAESRDEMVKLLRKAGLAREKYSREPRKILVILTARRDALMEMREMAEREGVELIVGKTID
ncbi:MAG: hypothetical protein QW639_06575 [Candidatus Bathyarchaeia archaeon]